MPRDDENNDNEEISGTGGSNPMNILKHIKGLDFPASRQEIIDYAKEHGGSETGDVIKALNRIPDRTYETPAGIMHEIGQIE